MQKSYHSSHTVSAPFAGYIAFCYILHSINGVEDPQTRWACFVEHLQIACCLHADISLRLPAAYNSPTDGRTLNTLKMPGCAPRKAYILCRAEPFSSEKVNSRYVTAVPAGASNQTTATSIKCKYARLHPLLKCILLANAARMEMQHLYHQYNIKHVPQTKVMFKQ